MRFTGITVLKVENGLITEEIVSTASRRCGSPASSSPGTPHEIRSQDVFRS